MSSSISSFFSSFLPVVHADSEEKPETETESTEPEQEEEAKEEEEAEQEEPEDPHPVIREECKAAKCAQLAQHFEHCQEKVSSGRGFKGEDCVEELFHMMHCVDDCTAPKLFTKLR